MMKIRVVMTFTSQQPAPSHLQDGKRKAHSMKAVSQSVSIHGGHTRLPLRCRRGSLAAHLAVRIAVSLCFPIECFLGLVCALVRTGQQRRTKHECPSENTLSNPHWLTRLRYAMLPCVLCFESFASSTMMKRLISIIKWQCCNVVRN